MNSKKIFLAWLFANKFLAVAFFLFPLISSSQNLHQTIRGTVLDKQTQSPLPGSAVIVLGTDPVVGTTCDENGKFRIENVPLGRWVVKFSFIGYKEKTLAVTLNSGKETVVTAEIEESIIEGQEIIVVAEVDKTKTNNKNASVSARVFSIEESSRYAGSRNDPARMAANFAGVSGANDSRNDIVIRGNSPLSVLWRLNGIDIPNPNHFGTLGTTGGPISILNNNTLGNSDFFTSAFPADYGNAVAGVFDLKMKSGNNEKYEMLAQIGFNGFELGAEGPLHPKKKNGSFLINYRYSTLQVFNALGINFGTGAAIPQYQDVTFKVDMPTKKFGKFSLWGLGGISYVALLDSEKDKKENLYGYSGLDSYFRANVGACGLSHVYIINSSSYTKINVGASGQYNSITANKVDTSFQPPLITPYYRNTSYTLKYSTHLSYNKKFNSKNFITIGFLGDQLNALFTDSVDDGFGFYTLRNYKGSTYLMQAYLNWQHHFNKKIMMNAGVHYQQFFLNNSWIVEPRLGFKYTMTEKQTLSIGGGLHSQMVPLYIYFATTTTAPGQYTKTNVNLDFYKSIHGVISHDVNLGKNTRIKSEIYYQYLYDVPVKTRPSYFSSLNLGADFNSPNIDSLVNNGTGENYGLEFTLERFFHQGFYFLVTGSLFESFYTGSDKIKRNTAFNGNYVLNVLAGKEFKIKEKHVIGIDFKVTAAGGKRYVRIDLDKSRLANEEVLDPSDAYQNQHTGYFRIDIKPSYKLNMKKVTLEINCDFQNVTRNDNVFQQIYDVNSKEVKTDYQLKFFFIPQLKLYF